MQIFQLTAYNPIQSNPIHYHHTPLSMPSAMQSHQPPKR